MMNFRLITALLAICIGGYAQTAGGGWADYVNTLMGTASTYELSAGNTYPAVAMPWGMNTWTPQTGPNGDGWIYTYTCLLYTSPSPRD